MVTGVLAQLASRENLWCYSAGESRMLTRYFLLQSFRRIGTTGAGWPRELGTMCRCRYYRTWTLLDEREPDADTGALAKLAGKESC